jgi:hypothetical protein
MDINLAIRCIKRRKKEFVSPRCGAIRLTSPLTRLKERLSMKTRKFYTIIGILAICAFGLAFMGCPPDGSDDDPPPAHTHQWGEWTETKAATCIATGERTRTCTLDQTHTEKEETAIAPNAHDWDEWDVETAPTCTETGIGSRVCKLSAEHTENGISIPALGHNSGAWHITLDATCTAAGTKELRCTRDNHVLSSDTITALGHTANTETGLCMVCNALTYNLGDTGPGGGKIFYRLEAGFTQYANAADTAGTTAHYLEATPADMPTTLTWASSGFTNADISGTGEAIGTGRKNAALILATDTDAPAAKACNDYSNGGKTDWFLPSRYELNELYVNRTSVDDNMGTNTYWSSSQGNENVSGNQYFYDGGQSASTKNSTHSVRAVRAF